MKLWIDECLSPTLVQRANERGYWATCNRDRGLLGMADEDLHRIVLAEEAAFVTNNQTDFVVLCRKVDLHTGLVILPQTSRREDQWSRLGVAVDHIEKHAQRAREEPAAWLINTYVDVDANLRVSHGPLP